jgi:hypothetical protein
LTDTGFDADSLDVCLTDLRVSVVPTRGVDSGRDLPECSLRMLDEVDWAVDLTGDNADASGGEKSAPAS